MSETGFIRVYGARQHNLKNINVEIPRGVLTAITGVSGSGKSTLAFDTLFAEGQRRYVESLSVSARQYLEQMQKPDFDRIEGLSPTIAIEQRGAAANPRSTVASATEIHDFLRVLYARVGEPKCWKCDRPIRRQSTAEVVDSLLVGPSAQRIMILAPVIQGQRGSHKEALNQMLKEGFIRVRVDGDIVMIEDLPLLAPNRKHTIDIVIDRLSLKPGVSNRLAESIDTAARLADGRILITAEDSKGSWTEAWYSSVPACAEHPEVRLESLNPPLFSFNTPQGACPACHGLGTQLEFDPDLIVSDQNVNLSECALTAWRRLGPKSADEGKHLIDEFCGKFEVSALTPIRELSPDLVKSLIHGSNKTEGSQSGAEFEGLIPRLRRRWEATESEAVKQRLYEFLASTPCTDCRGTRLRREALCVQVESKNIAEVSAMTIEQAAQFIGSLAFKGEAATVAAPLLDAIRHRLDYLMEVGVSYLNLNRSVSTLSGGEWQRIRLATHIGGGLSGVCYVLDEPTVGLHPRDSRRLTDILLRLCQLGNSAIVVEHEPEVISAAAYLIEMGPMAGSRGGYVVAQGRLQDVLKSNESLSAMYLSGTLSCSASASRRPVKEGGRCIELRGVSAHNLKNITVRFPLGRLICVAGVSGSGKSTLVSEVLLRALKRKLNHGGPRPGAFEEIVGAEQVDKVVEVDQSPIGRTPRSNPATYLGTFGLIRELYAKTRESKVRGYGASRFSFNVKGGRCDHCDGQGTRRIAMHFLPDVYVPCASCGGSRYNRETLEIRYRGKSISDVLAMSVEEATEFFDAVSRIREKLQALGDVGLGYLTLGQPSNTLSGGEAQRIKLASELHKSGDGHVLYVLDEPTTGLHFTDVNQLLVVLNRLVDQGHSVIVIEHNLDVMAAADWIIDLGPDGGDAGGEVVAFGTPEEIIGCTRSQTGQFLRNHLTLRPPVAP